MAFRYIEDNDKDFFDDMHHQNIKSVPIEERIPVHTSDDIDKEMEKQFSLIRDKKLGVLLSGGMDSAIAASYMQGADAYTFRFLGGTYQKDELERAEYYAKYYGLALHYVDIDWNTVISNINIVMEAKAAPVHSIEPQIFQAALQALDDGIEMMVIGESADLVFGGMDQLLGKEWKFDEFVKRYTFTNPFDVLKDPKNMEYLYERYRVGEDGIDYLKFMDNVFSIESSGSYMNAFLVAGLSYFDPYAKLIMADPLDLYRVRNGEPKYLIRDLMKKKYPEISVPNKIPMPRLVDSYFRNWEGPKRPEFIAGLDMSRFNGNQKWQMWCLERFLNYFEND